MEIFLEILHVLGHSALDTLKLIPFLFLTYLLMEFLEHRAGGKLETALRRAGRFGPVAGGILGAVPQCGFSAAISGLYAGRVVTPGALVAVFLATSDEMIPVAVAGAASPLFILKVLGFKVGIGIAVGLLTDLIVHALRRGDKAEEIESLCEEAHCGCEKGIWRSAIHHTLQVGLFLFLITVVLTGLIETLGEESIADWFVRFPVLGPVVAAVVGLIPNCASSVVITQLYLDGVLSGGCLMAGLLSGAGVGLLVLFRVNHRHFKENLLLLATVFAVGALTGVLFDLTGLSALL